MNAEVTILVDRKENVLSVPVQAILEYSGKDHVAVKTPNGFDRREVELGATNDKFVEVTKGITDGTIVALNPLALLSENEKRELFGVDGKAAGKKDWAGFAKGKAAEAAPGPSRARAGRRGWQAGRARRRQGGRRHAKAKGKARAKGRGKGAGGSGPSVEKIKNIAAEDRAKMKGAIRGGAGRDPQEGRLHRRRARADAADAGANAAGWRRRRWRRRWRIRRTSAAAVAAAEAREEGTNRGFQR